MLDITKELQNTFYKEIPLSKSMKIEVKSFNEKVLELYAPLEVNINHMDTAFGGSLYNLAVLTGWGLVYTVLAENNLTGHIIIQDATIKYLKPIATDMYANCTIENEGAKDKFLKIYKKRGLSRIHLKVNVYDENKNLGVTFEGSYVVSK